jgi:hypothetical protein
MVMRYEDAADLTRRLVRVADTIVGTTRRRPEFHMHTDDYNVFKTAMMSGDTYYPTLHQSQSALWGYDLFRDDSVPMGEVHVKTPEETHRWMEWPHEYAITWHKEVVYIDPRP